MRMNTVNTFLGSLVPEDQALLSAHLQPVQLAYQQKLVRCRCWPDHVFFPEDSLVTVFALSSYRDHADVGTIGSEGCTAIEVILGCERANHDAIVQISGHAHQLETRLLI